MPAPRPPGSTVMRVVGGICLALAVAVPIVLLVNHPHDIWWAPRCAWHDLTGLRCPGCGLTRATYHLLHGEIWLALQNNPLAPLLPLLFLAGVWFFGVMLVKGRVPHIPAPPVTVGWLIAAALGGFWIYRTIVDLIRGPG